MGRSSIAFLNPVSLSLESPATVTTIPAIPVSQSSIRSSSVISRGANATGGIRTRFTICWQIIRRCTERKGSPPISTASIGNCAVTRIRPSGSDGSSFTIRPISSSRSSISGAFSASQTRKSHPAFLRSASCSSVASPMDTPHGSSPREAVNLSENFVPLVSLSSTASAYSFAAAAASISSTGKAAISIIRGLFGVAVFLPKPSGGAEP